MCVDTKQYGWVCPKCGGVYAPFVMECHRCCQPVVVSTPWCETTSDLPPSEWVTTTTSTEESNE
jgi:hypothetical protein